MPGIGMLRSALAVIFRTPAMAAVVVALGVAATLGAIVLSSDPGGFRPSPRPPGGSSVPAMAASIHGAPSQTSPPAPARVAFSQRQSPPTEPPTPPTPTPRVIEAPTPASIVTPKPQPTRPPRPSPTPPSRDRAAIATAHAAAENGPDGASPSSSGRARARSTPTPTPTPTPKPRTGRSGGPTDARRPSDATRRQPRTAEPAVRLAGTVPPGDARPAATERAVSSAVRDGRPPRVASRPTPTPVPRTTRGEDRPDQRDSAAKRGDGRDRARDGNAARENVKGKGNGDGVDRRAKHDNPKDRQRREA